jgi:3-oxoacyl-[acyl-carrier protein] reductase
MKLELQNKVVVITGGTKGIGLAMVKGFIKEDAIVHVIARNCSSAIEQLMLQFPKSLYFYSCNAANQTELKETYNNILSQSNDTIDILISNVGSGKGTPDPISNDENWNSSWDTNFNSALYSARLFSPSIVKSKGSILFISSIAGIEYIGAPIDYSTAKAALIAFSKNLAHKLAPEVRVNIIAPGNIFFEGGTWGEKMRNDPERIRLMLDEKVPLKRFGTPEEVCDLALYLSSFRAGFITGGCFVIDGGQTISF